MFKHPSAAEGDSNNMKCFLRYIRKIIDVHELFAYMRRVFFALVMVKPDELDCQGKVFYVGDLKI